MLTKKTFEVLARGLAATKPQPDAGCPAYIQWTLDVTKVADVCAASNPRFDQARFLQACGV